MVSIPLQGLQPFGPFLVADIDWSLCWFQSLFRDCNLSDPPTSTSFGRQSTLFQSLFRDYNLSDPWEWGGCKPPRLGFNPSSRITTFRTTMPSTGSRSAGPIGFNPSSRITTFRTSSSGSSTSSAICFNPSSRITTFRTPGVRLAHPLAERRFNPSSRITTFRIGCLPGNHSSANPPFQSLFKDYNLSN